MKDERVIGQHFACFGDSIVSDQVTGMGTLISELLGTKLVGNFAVGYATCSDWKINGKDVSPEYLKEPDNEYCAKNVLSNQIRRVIRYYKETGEAPDIIYIAIGINDGNSEETAVKDDFEELQNKSIKDVQRTSMAGALIRGIDDLKCTFPHAIIFAASPMLTVSDHAHMQRDVVMTKRAIVQKVCRHMQVHFLDNTFESGFTEDVALKNGDSVHPNEENKRLIAENVVRMITERI